MELIQEFVADCKARGLTRHTIETYQSNVIVFLEAFNEPSKVNLDDLRTFLGVLRERNLQGSTLKGYFASISALYEFLVFEGKMQGNPIPTFRKRYLRIKIQYGGENTRQPGSLEQIKELLDIARKDILGKTMMLFLAKTGLRRGELIAMDVYDLDLENGAFRVKPLSKRTNRLGFLDAELTGALREYLDWREPLAKEGALWINPKKGYRVSKNFVYYTIRGYTELTGLHNPHGALIEKFTTHNLRHFFTTHMRRNGMHRKFLKELRGDRNGDAVDIYDHIDPEELRRSYLECVPQLGVGPGRQGTLEAFV